MILTLDEKAFALKELARGDVVQQMAALGQSQQLLAPLEKQLAIQRNILTNLAGRLPSEEVSETFKFASLRLPTKLPVSFPSALVLQRPDVRAADAAVHQAGAEVGVALANRLPQFRVSGDAGSSAINLTQLFSGPAGFYSIVGRSAHRCSTPGRCTIGSARARTPYLRPRRATSPLSSPLSRASPTRCGRCSRTRRR